MFLTTLVVVGGLCLAFKSTRLTGVAGLTLLALVFPPLLLAFLVIGSAAIYFVHIRRNHHVFTIPKLLHFRRR